MVYLLLSIISSSVIFITFKISERFQTDLIKVITVNYLIASILGFTFNRHPTTFSGILYSNWLIYSIVIGISFILMFLLIGHSIRRSGVTVTTIAGKMSMVIPILFSIGYFSEQIVLFKILGLILATASVLLTVYRPITNATNRWLVFFPVIIFAGSGISDSLVKYAQAFHVPNNLGLLFSACVFLAALICGLIVILFGPMKVTRQISIAEIIAGTILGIANFGSLYFFIMALNNSRLESSIVFGLNNLCIVLISVFFGSIVFKEKLSKLNFVGIAMAVVAIVILINY